MSNRLRSLFKAPFLIVLATSMHNKPQSRIVAVREITETSILFFTQRGTKKVTAIIENPNVSMTLWLPMQQREVVLDGTIAALTQTENNDYWQTMPRDRQLRFHAYAQTSLQPITSIAEIDHRYTAVSEQFCKSEEIPMCAFYCGCKFVANALYFYTLGTENFSEVIRYETVAGVWQTQQLSP